MNFALPKLVKPKKRLFSPITLRLLVVNMFALGILVVGILYLGEYRRGLIIGEVTALEVQGEMFAAALGEGASVQEIDQRKTLVFSVARQMVERLVQQGTRARLFALDGSIISDSGDLIPLNSDLKRLEDLTLIEAGLRVAEELTSRVIFGEENLPVYIEPPIQTAAYFPEAGLALRGEYGGMIRDTKNGGIMISVAVPVTRDNQVLGALMLSKGSADIENALFDVRLHIFKMFLISFAVTIFVSLYFAGTIARPLRMLAKATDALRRGTDHRVEIPNLSRRNDEIGDLSAAMREMTHSLWQRMDAIESFAADVAHELKNPLTSLKSAIETAQRVENPDAQKKLMDIVMHDIHRLDLLITDISEASRVDAEMSRTQDQVIDLNAMLDLLGDVENFPNDPRNITLKRTKSHQGPLYVKGSENRLVQVFRNLIGNARSFSPDNSEIDLIIMLNQTDIHILVEDNGPGIPSGNEHKIFDRFYTERPTQDEFGNHSGLGLAICKQIIEAHQGSIWAENRLNPNGDILGARLVVTLPRV